MTTADEIRMQLLEVSTQAEAKRHEAARLEVERSEWVALQVQKKIDEGVAKSPADKAVHQSPEHRSYQKRVEDLTHESNLRFIRSTDLRYQMDQELLAARRELLLMEVEKVA